MLFKCDISLKMLVGSPSSYPALVTSKNIFLSEHFSPFTLSIATYNFPFDLLSTRQAVIYSLSLTVRGFTFSNIAQSFWLLANVLQYLEMPYRLKTTSFGDK